MNFVIKFLQILKKNLIRHHLKTFDDIALDIVYKIKKIEVT